MTTDTLPELPTPKYSETIRGVPCITLTEHEHLMREYALQARAQPAEGESVAWNTIQIASWIGSQLMHEPSMFERAVVCKFVRSLGRHPTLLKHSPKIHPAPSVPATGEPVYQICKKDSQSISSAWIDVEKQAYEDAGMYPEYGRRTLYTRPAPSVPEGYALVPIEPTDEMMSEMLGPFIAINGDNRSAFIEAYPRMLTAAKKETP